MTKPSPDAAGDWTGFARELATMDDVVLRLLSTHTRAANGRCEACTTPGRGTPQLPWPCAMWTLARAAQRIRNSWNGAGTDVPTPRPD